MLLLSSGLTSTGRAVVVNERKHVFCQRDLTLYTIGRCAL